MTAFVLIHGAFRGGWCWRDVVRGLRAHGHDAFAPSLTGAGDRRHLPQPTRLQTYVDDVVNVLVTWDLRAAVVVGHSFGGVPITAASHACPDRIGRLAYLDAPEPRHGERAADLVPTAARGGFPEPPPGTVLPPRPIEPTSGIDAATAAWATERLSPFPVDPSLEPVSLTSAAARALPRSYAFCRDTPPVYPAWHTRARLDADGTVYTVLPTGHDAPLQAPAVVVEWLLATYSTK